MGDLNLQELFGESSVKLPFFPYSIMSEEPPKKHESLSLTIDPKIPVKLSVHYMSNASMRDTMRAVLQKLLKEDGIEICCKNLTKQELHFVPVYHSIPSLSSFEGTEMYDGIKRMYKTTIIDKLESICYVERISIGCIRYLTMDSLKLFCICGKIFYNPSQMCTTNII